MNAYASPRPRLKTLVEYRMKACAPYMANGYLQHRKRTPYLIGHGQQLARAREAKRAEFLKGFYRETPLPSDPGRAGRRRLSWSLR